MATKPLHFDVHGQLCILSIDDDEVNLLVIEQLLRPQGWKVVSAVDGEEGMEALEEGDTWPDFVFLDYSLNIGDSGDEVCRKMRARFGDVPVPIVMCTALTAGHKALEECKLKGATDHLLKPYDRKTMIDMVEKHCGSKVMGIKKEALQVPEAAAAPPSTSSLSTLEAFLKSYDLEYCGKKLESAGLTIESLKTVDDAALRKAGIVIKAQRDKILEAAKCL